MAFFGSDFAAANRYRTCFTEMRARWSACGVSRRRARSSRSSSRARRLRNIFATFREDAAVSPETRKSAGSPSERHLRSSRASACSALRKLAARARRRARSRPSSQST